MILFEAVRENRIKRILFFQRVIFDHSPGINVSTLPIIFIAMVVRGIPGNPRHESRQAVAYPACYTLMDGLGFPVVRLYLPPTFCNGGLKAMR